jgi:hypothetical protein
MIEAIPKVLTALRLFPVPVMGCTLGVLIFSWGDVLAVVIGTGVLETKTGSELSIMAEGSVLATTTGMEASLDLSSGDAVLALDVLTSEADVEVPRSEDEDSALVRVVIDVEVSHSLDDVVVPVVQGSVDAVLGSGMLETLYATETLFAVVKPQTATAGA